MNRRWIHWNLTRSGKAAILKKNPELLDNFVRGVGILGTERVKLEAIIEDNTLWMTSKNYRRLLNLANNRRFKYELRGVVE